MLKRLTRKLVALSVFCTALAAVSSTPAPSTASWQMVCERQVSEESCIIYCCDRWSCYEYPCN